ncbi:Uncharacterised protein [Mycobacteroides abscessus subsp. abscessus]|nr:Uncharacterised protein [Mycobacteroides abscessus subsp. abscessus]
MSIDHVGDNREERVEERRGIFRRPMLGQRGGSDDVDEQHPDLAVRSVHTCTVFDGELRDGVADVPREQFTHPLTFVEALHHLVEAVLQHAELRRVVHVDVGGEVAILDPLHGVPQFGERIDDGLPDQHDHAHSRSEADCGQHHRRPIDPAGSRGQQSRSPPEVDDQQSAHRHEATDRPHRCHTGSHALHRMGRRVILQRNDQ